MQRSVRNLGRSGLAACAISAVDTALWDIKARALDLPLARLLGRCRDRVPIYGSGGFTSYSDQQLRDQLAGWVDRDGCRFVKMKIGSEPERDPDRVPAGQGGDRRPRALRRCQWRVFRQAGARLHASLRRSRHPLVRGAGNIGRSAGTASDARTRARSDGHRRRRIHLHVRRCAPHAASRCRRCAAGRRHAMRRHHRVLADRRAVRSASHRFIRPLRAGDAPPRRLRGAAAAPSRVVSRSRPDRAHAVRRRARRRDGAIEPDLGQPGHGLTFKRQDAERFRVNGEAS